MKNFLKTATAFALVAVAATLTCHAILPAPEIDPQAGTAGLALIGGAIMVLRGRRKR